MANRDIEPVYQRFMEAGTVKQTAKAYRGYKAYATVYQRGFFPTLGIYVIAPLENTPQTPIAFETIDPIADILIDRTASVRKQRQQLKDLWFMYVHPHVELASKKAMEARAGPNNGPPTDPTIERSTALGRHSTAAEASNETVMDMAPQTPPQTAAQPRPASKVFVPMEVEDVVLDFDPNEIFSIGRHNQWSMTEEDDPATAVQPRPASEVFVPMEVEDVVLDFDPNEIFSIGRHNRWSMTE